MKWLIVGDSHTVAFRWAVNFGFIKLPASVVTVGGATAIGLWNRDSQTQAVIQFEDALLPFDPENIPVFHLGEVDCGFLIWSLADRLKDDIDVLLERSISTYMEFVDRVIAIGYKNVVISGATIPTIQDNAEWSGEVVSFRKAVKATLAQRTDLTLRYNRRLRLEADARKLPYIDIWDFVVDQETGVVKESFCFPSKTDHHLIPTLVGPLWAAELNRLEIARL